MARILCLARGGSGASGSKGIEHLDQFGRLDLGDRSLADVREVVGFEAPHHLGCVLVAASSVPMCPLGAGHGLEGVGRYRQVRHRVGRTSYG